MLSNSTKSYEFEVVCRNLKNGKIFSKFFTAEFPCRQFVQKCKYSKKIRILEIEDIYGSNFNFDEVYKW